jgi:hypothetical protein
MVDRASGSVLYDCMPSCKLHLDKESDCMSQKQSRLDSVHGCAACVLGHDGGFDASSCKGLHKALPGSL